MEFYGVVVAVVSAGVVVPIVETMGVVVAVPEETGVEVAAGSGVVGVVVPVGA